MAIQAGAQYIVPYTQNFDGISGAVGNGRHSENAGINTLTSYGFSVYTSGTACTNSKSCGQIHVANNTTASYRKSGVKSLAFPALNDPTNGTSKYLLLPQFSSTYRVNTLMVKFWMGTSSNSKGVLSVGYVTANDTSTFVSIVDIPASAETFCSSGGLQTTAGRTVEVSLNMATDHATRIALRWVYKGAGTVNTADVAVCCIDDLEVDEIPACPPVSGLAATPQYTTANLSWIESGSATQWQVKLGSGSSVTVSANPYTLTGLTPGTEYTATVAAVCGSETSETRSVTFTTLSCDPVTDLTAEALYNSAVLNWTEAGGATEWQVTLGSGTPVTVTSPTHSFTGLAPNTDYAATVRASCGGGLLSAPVSVNFHTACPQPTALAATDVTNGRIVLEWRGNASQYEVQLASNNAFTADFQTQTVSTATATFPNLNIGERYYVRVRAKCGTDVSAWTPTLGADVQLYFQPAASDGMEVEFEALWARAWLTIAYTDFGMGTGSDASRGVYKQNVGVERNFCVLQDYGTYIFQRRSSGEGRRIADVDGNFPTVPVTYTSVLPNGTSDGTTKAYEALSTTVLNIRDNYCYYTADLPVRCHADTRFEYLTLGVGNSGGIHGVVTVHRSSFSADGYNFTMGRGMKHVSKEGSGNFDNDHGINYLWGIGRITSPDKVDQAGTHQFYTDHFEEIITANSYVQNLSANAPNPDALPGYSAADSNYINTTAATYRATGRSLNYTMRLETGSIGYPLAYYGWNNFVNYSSYGNGSGKRGLYTVPHVWVTGTDNRVRLILGNDYDRAREDSKQWAPEMAKDSCSLRTSVPFLAGNYWIQMPNQDQSKVMFTAVIKSGFHGYRMWRRAYDSATGSFYAGDHKTPGFNYDTSGYSGSEGKWGPATNQIDFLSSSNGSLPYGFGDGGTDGDPKNIYIGVSNNPTMFKGKRHCLIEGGYLWTSISGCAWDTAMTNRGDNDVAIIRMKGGQLYGSIFGGTNTYADGAGGRQIICTGGKVWGWISGGANGTSIADQNSLAGHHWGNTYIYVGGTFELGNDTADRRVGTYINTVGRTGANDGNLFGAGCGIKPYSKYASASFNENAWKFHECGEVLNSTVVVADEAHVRYDVYGGGNYGYNKVGCGSDVRILGGRVGGKVFGGSNNKSTGSSYIRMTGGTVEQGVYGGCNNWGILLGDVRMDILGGTIGTDTWNTAGVYGGVYGQNAKSATSYGDIHVRILGSGANDVYGANNESGKPMGKVLVTIGSNDSLATDRNLPQVNGNVYGGGNMAACGTHATTTTLTVEMLSGTVQKNVFGGGRGTTAVVNLPSGHAGLSNGRATEVFIKNGSVQGNVYGGGNAAKVIGNTHVEIGD